MTKPSIHYLSLFSGIEAASQTRREDSIRCAKVYLAEAARRRHHLPSNDFFWTLLQWASNSRKRAMTAPAQHNLPFMEHAA